MRVNQSIRLADATARSMDGVAIQIPKAEAWIMFWKVSDIALDYEKPGDEIVADRIEADNPRAAIIAALTAISSSYIADLLRSYPDGVEKYILPDFDAEPVA
jgi:hypothetical protein